jgi:intracellular sulfur oxidation DsrE/DsrF family protein
MPIRSAAPDDTNGIRLTPVPKRSKVFENNDLDMGLFLKLVRATVHYNDGEENMRRFSIALITLIFGAGALPGVAKPLNVVIQLNDGAPEKIEGALRNVHHFVEAARKRHEAVKVSVVVFGSALAQFAKAKADPKTATTFKEIVEKEKEVSWFACENTLERVGLKLSDLMDGYKPVPSGVYEVVRLQSEGFIYFRP